MELFQESGIVKMKVETPEERLEGHLEAGYRYVVGELKQFGIGVGSVNIVGRRMFEDRNL